MNNKGFVHKLELLVPQQLLTEFLQRVTLDCIQCSVFSDESDFNTKLVYTENQRSKVYQHYEWLATSAYSQQRKTKN